MNVRHFALAAVLAVASSGIAFAQSSPAPSADASAAPMSGHHHRHHRHHKHCRDASGKFVKCAKSPSSMMAPAASPTP